MSDATIRNQNPAVRGAAVPAQTEGAKTEKAGRSKDASAAYAKSANNEPPSVKNAANVNISQKAREMSMAKKAAEDAPDVRESKVSAFKDKIKEGYKVDPEKVADGIAREAIRDELSSTSRA